MGKNNTRISVDSISISAINHSLIGTGLLSLYRSITGEERSIKNSEQHGVFFEIDVRHLYIFQTKMMNNFVLK